MINAAGSRRHQVGRDLRRSSCESDSHQANVPRATKSPPEAAAQTSSFDFRSALTAFGSALPPVDFITWPTNHWIAAGLALACSTLSGLARDDVVDDLLDRREVGDLLHAAALDKRPGVAALLPDDLEQVFGDLSRDCALADQIDNGGQLPRRHRRVRDPASFLVQSAEQLVDHPVRRDLAVAGAIGETGQHAFIEVGALTLGHQHPRIIGRQAKISDEAAPLLVRQLGQISLQRVDEGLRKLQRQQVGIGEVAVVVRLFL